MFILYFENQYSFAVRSVICACYMQILFDHTGWFIMIFQNQLTSLLVHNHSHIQSSKLAGSPKPEASEIMLRTSETILALVRSD